MYYMYARWSSTDKALALCHLSVFVVVFHELYGARGVGCHVEAANVSGGRSRAE